MSVKSIKFIDKYIGNITCNFLSIFNKKSSKDKINKILLVQLWGIGETTLMLPSIEAIRKKFRILALAFFSRVESRQQPEEFCQLLVAHV